MDALLQTLGAQTFNFAVRSGIALTSKYAVQQCARLLKSVNDKAIRSELRALQRVLDSKIKILSPALDLIEFKSSRGNAFLEAAVPLAKSLHRDIIRLGKRLHTAATVEETETHRDRGPRNNGDTSPSEAHGDELMLIVRDIKNLLERIDRDIPLLQFAITVSGERMSTSLTPGISPSRMMQASALLSFADAHFSMDPRRPMQVGSSFTLSLYMLFLGHSETATPYGLGAGERKPIWQEVMHKSRVRLCRIPTSCEYDPTKGYQPGRSDGSRKTAAPITEPLDGYSYHLEIIEDLDDTRLHDGDGSKPQPYDGIPMAGIRESIPIHQISKIFYTDTGSILNVGNGDERNNNPVLLLKRDPSAKCPIKMRQEWFDNPEQQEEEESRPTDTTDDFDDSDDQDDVDRQLWEETEHSTQSPMDDIRPTQLPPHFDQEWLALEVYVEEEGSDDEDDEVEDEDESDGESETNGASHRALTANNLDSNNKTSVDAGLETQMQRISLQSDFPPHDLSHPATTDLQQPQQALAESYVTRSPFGSITSSLSLLEMLIRLTSLQEFQQTPHLAIPDHILMFFLEETSTTGLHGEAHWQMRSEAKRKMGFDPYTDSYPRQGDE
ncbi:RanGTP-binding protein-domain-containing protein [Dichotomopilus funicola]|uniref:RanGTP-binding protein-domain-containing protein n=1 Tax=Dichotomopilus funicola TaxID=1934379 RepID=A0AAN6V735_9PEZI|nr:RanGTP-binding protein-domain-containing protein [Dichotomopilus funicola]